VTNHDYGQKDSTYTRTEPLIPASVSRRLSKICGREYRRPQIDISKDYGSPFITVIKQRTSSIVFTMAASFERPSVKPG